MAPSYKCAVISLIIIVFSVTAPKPSAAIRSSEPEAAASKSPHHAVDDAPAPAPRGARHAQLQFFFGCPTFPKILRDLCHALFPPPTPSPPSPPTPPSPPRHHKPCRPSLMKRVPSCAAFLTNASVSQPDSECCDRMRMFDDDDDGSGMLRYCVCYVANGDVDAMLPAPVVDPARSIGVVTACIGISEENVHFLCDKDGNVYKGLVPPMDDPPSPPPAHEKKA